MVDLRYFTPADKIQEYQGHHSVPIQPIYCMSYPIPLTKTAIRSIHLIKAILIHVY